MADPKDIRRAMMIASEPLKVPSTYASMEPDARAAWKTDQMAREGHGSFSPPGTPEREENFSRWHGSSKIRDGEGNPLRLYHATPKSFDTFIPGGTNIEKEMPSGPATWLSPYPDKQPAGHHVGGFEDKYKSGANVMPVHADIRNPLVIDNKTMRDWARQSYAKGSGEFPLLVSPESRKMLLEDGYDGILWAGFNATSKDDGGYYDDHAIGEHPDKEEEIIALHPPGRAQIKSAIGNRGQYDPEDTHVNYARGGDVDTRRALMIARDQRALLRRIANIYPGPGGGMDPTPGGGGYSGPGGGKYIGPSHYADGGGVDDYGGEHRPPGPEDGAPLHDLTGQGRVYPDDIYGPNAARYYGHGDDPLDHGTMSIIRQFKGRPSAKAAIYRAVPSGLTTAEKLADLEKAMAANMRRGVVPEGESRELQGSVWYNKAHAERARLRALPPEPETKTDINPGDWVTINRQYAKDHGESTLRGKYKIVRKTVRADELYTDGNSIHEYGYWPRTQRADGGSVPPFKLHSGAAKIIKSKGQAKATPQQYAAMPGIKPDELKYSKFDTLGSKALPREEVIKHLEDNRLPIEETQLGGEGRNTATKFHDPKYQLPGGENYREVLLHLPGGETVRRSRIDAINDESLALLNGRSVNQLSPEEMAKWEALSSKHDAVADATSDFTGPHWEEPDVLAHLRLTNRVGPNGEKILHLEEAQSDWGQQGREKGFSNPEVANRQRELFQKLNDIKKAHVEAQRDVETKHKINLREFDAAYKDAMGGAESKFNASRMTKSDIDAYNEASDLALTKTQHLLDPAEKIRQEAHKQIHTAFAPKIEALEKEFSALPKHGDIPHGPYVDNTQKWTDLALKRVLHEAAHGGYDKIVVTPGDEQNKRYSLEKHVKNIQYYPDLGYLHATTHDNQGVEHEDVKPEDLSKHIGKEAADRILKQGMQRYEGRGKLGGEFYHELEGDGLKMGGAGMRGYYDNILPKRLQALAQQHDPQAKVNLHAHDLSGAPDPAEVKNRAISMAHNTGDIDDPTEAAWNAADPEVRDWHTEHATAEQARTDFAEGINHAVAPLHSLDVTPQMRDSIKANGFNSFKRGGDVGMRQRYADGGGTGGDHPAWIPTRLITSKKHTPTAGERHIVDVASMKQTPDVFRSNVDLVRAYPNTTAKVAGYKNHDKVADAFIDHVTGNLLALHDAVPEHIRQRSKLWYDGARAITDRWSQKYDLPDHSIAGALAALSPQKDWYQNVSLAERVLDAMRGSENFYKGFTFNDKMAKTFASRPSLNKPAYEGVRQLLNGRSLADLDGLDLSPAAKAQAKALWIRMHDEAHNDPAHRIITPEGGDGDFVATAKGAKAKVGWGSLTEIGKAIQAIENAGNPEVLSQLMGEKHKVRNFYNNILAPQSPHGDVTIDTHAVAAGLLRPLSGKSLEVAHNFANYPGVGLPAARGTAMTGIQGTYPLYADAYRKAAASRGILPREMQSITWEAVRGLFPDTAKTPAHNARVTDVWKQYRNGKIDQHEAQQRIVNLSAPHGIPAPSWFMGGSSGPDAGNQSPAGQGALSEPLVRGQAALAPVGRARGGSAPYVSPQSGRPPAHKVVTGRAGYAPGGGIDQLLQNLKGSFGQLNQQVAAQGPQQQQAMPQAPYGAYQRMERQATGQAPNDAYQRMMAQALNGKTYEEMFPTTPKVAAPAPAVAPVQFAADAMPYYQTNYDLPAYGTQGGSGGDSGGSGDGLKRGGRATNIVERALAVTRRK